MAGPVPRSCLKATHLGRGAPPGETAPTERLAGPVPLEGRGPAGADEHSADHMTVRVSIQGLANHVGSTLWVKTHSSRPGPLPPGVEAEVRPKGRDGFAAPLAEDATLQFVGNSPFSLAGPQEDLRLIKPRADGPGGPPGPRVRGQALPDPPATRWGSPAVRWALGVHLPSPPVSNTFTIPRYFIRTHYGPSGRAGPVRIRQH